MTTAADATVSVLHAIPAGRGVGTVDVYAGRTLLVDNLTPGKLRTVKVPGGRYNIVVLPDAREGRRLVTPAEAAAWPTGAMPASVCSGDRRYVVTLRPLLPGEQP